MAKKPKATTVNVALLTAIANASADAPVFVSQAEGTPLLAEGLIQVDTTLVNAEGKAPAIATDAGKQYLTNLNKPEEKSKPMFGIMKGIPVPPSQRGNRKGAGAPTQYPFADMGVGDTFFVPDSAKKGNAAKHLGSTVSQQNMHYREDTGEKHEVERTKRGPGNKAVKDEAGNKVKEKVTVPVCKPTRKYVLRAVKAGQVLGDWTAPEGGALIAREL